MRPVSAVHRLAPAARRRLGAVAAALALLLYGAFLGGDATVAPSGADSSGYFNWARLLLEGRLDEAPREIEGLPAKAAPRFLYCPHGFVPAEPDGRLKPTYPIGLPLLLAGALALGGAYGPTLLLLLQSVGLVALTYLLARQLRASVTAAVLAAAAVAGSPLVLNFGQQAFSDVPTACWTAAALWLALDRRRGTALAAGACASVALLLRPTNALLALPLLLALGGPRRFVACVLGGLPLSIGFLAFNASIYGSPLVTGYGDLAEYFSSRWVGTTLAHYARWLPVVATPLVVLALAAPLARGTERRGLAVHATWVAVLAGFYALYFFTHREWWYLRFLLPALPSLLALAAVAGTALARRPRLRATAPLTAAVASVVIAANTAYWWQEFNLRNTGPSVRVYTQLARLVREQVPARGVVLTAEASGALFYRLPHVLVRWDAIDDAWPRVRSASLAADRPIYAALFSFEDEARFRAAAPGDWQLVARDGFATLWRLPP